MPRMTVVYAIDPENPRRHGKPMRVFGVDAAEIVASGAGSLSPLPGTPEARQPRRPEPEGDEGGENEGGENDETETGAEDLVKMTDQQLLKAAKGLDIEGAKTMTRQELVGAISRRRAETPDTE